MLISTHQDHRLLFSFLKGQCKLVVLLAFTVHLCSAQAEVNLDGTLGPSGSLTGPDFLIPDTVGQTLGSNLFHSFSDFNIANTESATFTGPSVIDNVIGRVTGGNMSTIDGLLRSTIPDANLFLLNPNGIFFGPDASLDIDGSFHASTADYIGLGEGGRFDAAAPGDSVLTTAPPSAFGFLGPDPAPIAAAGNFLVVPVHQTLSLVGGNISIDNAFLLAIGGRINLVSVAASGEVELGNNGLQAEGFSDLGHIELDSSTVSVSADGNGTVFIRGGQLMMVDSSIFAATFGDETGAEEGIDAALTGELFMDNSNLSSDTFGSGGAGMVTVQAGNIEIRNSAVISGTTFDVGDGGTVLVEANEIVVSGEGSQNLTRITAQAGLGSTGNAGTLTVQAGHLEIRDGAEISSGTFGSGDGGAVVVEANEIIVSGDGSQGFTGIAVQSNASTGNAGTLTVLADRLEILDGGAISGTTFSAGDGGAILVEADEIIVSGDGSQCFTGIAVQSNASTGNAGTLTVLADRLEILDGGAISGTTFSAGDGGAILVEADEIIMVGDGTGRFTGITAAAGLGNTGDAGTLTIRAGRLEIRNAAKISSNTFGSGDGGAVVVEADEIVMSNDGAPFFTGIIARAGRESTGNAGTLSVRADRLDMRNVTESSDGTSSPGVIVGQNFTGITTDTEGAGDAGTVTVEVGLLTMTGAAEISSDTLFGTGNAGSVTVEADILDLDFSLISSSTFISTGNAGKVVVRVGRLEMRNNAVITTSTIFSPGQGGDITIEADDILISGNPDISCPFGDLCTGIVSQSRVGSSGDAGSITIVTTNLEIRTGAGVSTSTITSPGDGGDIAVTADKIILDGQGVVTRLGSLTQKGSGNAGNINVTTHSLLIRDGAEISTDTEQGATGDGGNIVVKASEIIIEIGGNLETGIVASSTGTGGAGSVTLETVNLHLSEGGKISVSTDGTGDGGNIQIQADVLTLEDNGIISAVSNSNGLAGDILIDVSQEFSSANSRITSEANFSDGGNITLNAENLVLLKDSAITTSVGSGFGGGGNISIDPIFVVLLNSQIIANAFGGPGGNIDIVTNFFFTSSDSVIEASSTLGVSGTIAISSPDTDVSGGITVLPENFLDISELLTERCGTRQGIRSNSLVVTGSGGLPADPGGYLSAAVLDNEYDIRTKGLGTLGASMTLDDNLLAGVAVALNESGCHP